MKFNALISRINKNGTGFAKFPQNVLSFFRYGERVKVIVKKNPKNITFYGKIIHYGVLSGVYVPKKLMNQHNLPGKREVTLEKSNGLLLKANSEGRIYLPNEFGKKLGLEKEDILELKVLFNGCLKKFYCKLNMRSKLNTTEYFVFLPREFYNGFCMLNKITKLKKNNLKSIYALDFNKILRNFTFAEIGDGKAILFLGHRVPVIINTKISLNEIAHYLGCYFADGTKRGNSWGICASTFEHANYFTKMHKLLIPDNKMDINLALTLNHKSKEKITGVLNLWRERCGISLDPSRAWLHFSKAEVTTGRNKFGTLVMKEHRQSVQIYYNALVAYLLDSIKKENDASLAKQFICGVIEGDGCLNARNRGHIQITTNNNEVGILEEFLIVSGLSYKTHIEKASGKIYINIGAMGIIEDIEKLGNLLFMYYPKRRKIFCERLCNTPVAKFLTGKQPSTSYWILKRFKEKGFLTKNNGLTSKGKAIQKALSGLD